MPAGKQRAPANGWPIAVGWDTLQGHDKVVDRERCVWCLLGLKYILVTRGTRLRDQTGRDHGVVVPIIVQYVQFREAFSVLVRGSGEHPTFNRFGFRRRLQTERPWHGNAKAVCRWADTPSSCLRTLSCAARGTVLITSSPRLPPLRLVGSQLLYGGGDGTEVQVRWGERKEALGSHSWGGGTPPVLISTPVLGCGIQTSDWRVDTASAHANVARQLTGRAGAATPWVQAVWPLAHALTCRTERLLPRLSPSVQKLPTSTAR